MTEIAKKCGVSDEVIAKICDKKIPTPGNL